MKKESGFSTKKVAELKRKRVAKKVSPAKKDSIFFENQEVKQNLQFFYDKEAKKYAETRKKFWHEEKVILNTITTLFEEGKKVRVLEFGCGSGRFATLLNQNFKGKFDYVGIDLSDELLSYASKDNPDLTFFQGDITKLIKNFEQESFDLIVGTSSFQHIPTKKERSYLMKNFYRVLDYDGIILMTNRSLSSWFIRKNWKAIIKSRIKSLIKFDKGIARDLLVPRADSKGNTYERFYHFFSLNELDKLSRFSGLTTKINKYLDENGKYTDNERVSRSSFFVATKNPIIN